MDPILEYLLEFNQTHSIEYKGRHLIPPGGLQAMLDDYKKFRLTREEPLPEQSAKEDIDTLLSMI